MDRLWKKDTPIIGSMLETDTYKITMLYFIYRFFPDLKVLFSFKNRNPRIKLADQVSTEQLREECRHVQSLCFTDNQLHYIRSWQLFPEYFIQALKEIRLPDPLVEKTSDGQFRIEARGPWFHTTLWELYLLPIISELNTRNLIGDDPSSHKQAIAEGERRLNEKIEVFKSLRWSIALLGLRRRATGDWERHVTDILLDKVPGRISGVSNVQIAREFNVESIGTNAHELAMALYALRRWESNHAAWQSQYEVLEKWQQLYGHKLLIMLPDTFGSNQFFKRLPWQYLYDWRGSRQDSGDPFVYGENKIALYNLHRIDPMQKLVFFTDGLNPVKMYKIERQFYGRIGGGFGLGTNGSNDLGLPAVPMVIKLIEAAGNPAVKLSDNLSKAMGPDDEVARAKQIFEYTNDFDEKCVY